MGLTIHYSLTTELPSPKDVRHLVESIRQFALDLPFEEVGEVKEFKGNDTDHRSPDDPDRWLKIQAGAFVNTDGAYLSVAPRHIIAFETSPGEGSEPANFGFCNYPAFVSGKGEKRLATGLDGWQWSSFCKTQYASNPAFGGVRNFARCHLSVIKLLDFIKKSGLATVEVRDEAGYWESCNLESLIKEVGDWNVFVAGFASSLRSQAGGVAIEAPITGFPNFEHLEAKGLDKLDVSHRAPPRPGNATESETQSP